MDRNTSTNRPEWGEPRLRPFGESNRSRQVAGAFVIMAGALPIAFIATTFYGRPPRLWSVLITIGIVGLLAWLVDGRRYVGAASASLAIGSALGIAAEVELDRYTFALLFGLLGLALLAVFRVNPAAVIGSAGLLLFTSVSAALLHLTGVAGPDPQPTVPQAWAYVPLMIAWGVVVLRQVKASYSRRTAGEGEAPPAGHAADARERAGVR